MVALPVVLSKEQILSPPRRNLMCRKAIVMTFLCLLALVATSAQNTQRSGNHFKSSSPNPLVGGDDGLRTTADFEAALASRPDANGKVFVSRCRFAPFSDSTNLYTPFAGTQTSDAIVGDTQFPFADVALPGRTGATGGQGVFARLGSCGDPVLAFGPDGTLYCAGLGCNFRAHSTASALSVSVSHDGGMTWSAPHMVTFTDPNVIFNDKDWISVGPDGTVYVTWTRFQSRPAGLFGFGSNPIAISRSHDGGDTWSDFTIVSDRAHPFDQGSQPQVAPDGTVYVAYEGATPSTGFAGDAIIVARSTDGGKSFTNQEVARAYDDSNCYPINVAQNRQTLSGEQF